MYRVRLIRRYEHLQQLEEAWTELLLNAEASTVFASYQWNVAWLHHFGVGSTPYVLTVWKDGQKLVAVAPFMIRRLGPLRILQLLGTGLSDYGDVLVRPGFAREAFGALFAYLRANHRSWDLADWREVPAYSPLLSYLRARRLPGFTITLVPQTPCPVIDLPDSWDAYTAGLERKRRYYVASFPRKFMREQRGSMEMIVDGGSALEEAVTTFHRLHLSRWEDREDSLSEEHTGAGFEPFLRDVCARCAEEGWLRIVSIKAGEQVAASSLNFMVHGRWNAYMKGFDPKFSKSRPGTVLDALRIQEAIKEGARQFDFGRGEEAYKSGFGTRPERNTRVLIAVATPRSFAAYTLLRMRIWMRGRRTEAVATDSD